MSSRKNWKLNEEKDHMSKFFKIGKQKFHITKYEYQNCVKQNKGTKIAHFIK
jgi:hypothetical protein